MGSLTTEPGWKLPFFLSKKIFLYACRRQLIAADLKVLCINIIVAEGQRSMSHQNMPPWHKDYFELKALKKKKAEARRAF